MAKPKPIENPEYMEIMFKIYSGINYHSALAKELYKKEDWKNKNLKSVFSMKMRNLESQGILYSNREKKRAGGKIYFIDYEGIFDKIISIVKVNIDISKFEIKESEKKVILLYLKKYISAFMEEYLMTDKKQVEKWSISDLFDCYIKGVVSLNKIPKDLGHQKLYSLCSLYLESKEKIPYYGIFKVIY